MEGTPEITEFLGDEWTKIVNLAVLFWRLIIQRRY